MVIKTMFIIKTFTIFKYHLQCCIEKFYNYVSTSHILRNLIYFSTVPPAVIPSPEITAVMPLNSTSFVVNWTITDPNNKIMVIWSNLRTGMMRYITAPENTNCFTVTGLNSDDNYKVGVIVPNVREIMKGNFVTVNGKNVCS